MSEHQLEPLRLELITEAMNELAQEIVIMKPNDSRQVSFLKRLSELVQLRGSLRLEADQRIGQCMDELACEMTSLNPTDPRRAQIVHEMMRLIDLSKENCS
jgi:ribosome maturation protein Sdo1